MASACFNVPSKTPSPVVLVKSAITIVSFSVSDELRAECRYRNHPSTAAIAIATDKTGSRIFSFGLTADPTTALCEATDEACATAEELEDKEARSLTLL